MGESHTTAEQYLTERTRKRRRIIGLFAVPLILLVAVAAYAIAACRYRLEHAELPKSLADLKELIPGDESEKNQRLTDPFDGQPLRFKSDVGRVIIYSVSDNLIDDGGVMDGEDPREGDFGYSNEK